MPYEKKKWIVRVYMILKYVKNAKINTKIASAILNICMLKMIYPFVSFYVVTGITKKSSMKT